MALQRFTAVLLVALIVDYIHTAGVNCVELNSNNFASTQTTKPDREQTEVESATLAPSSKVVAESPMLLAPSVNLSEARITSITFRSEEADVDKENDETISFGIRSFTVEVATPATEKPIPLNEKVSAANKINVQQAQASSLPILTMENDQDHNDKVSYERAKVFKAPADALTPKLTQNAAGKQEIIASVAALDVKSAGPISVNTDKFVHTAEQTDKMAQNTDSASGAVNEHKQLSISSNGMHVEQKLENGLYRIKIAEITTDEFNNGHDETKQILNENRSNHGQDKNLNSMLDTTVDSSQNGQMNIVDLYPSKIEDFSSIIRESNEKLIEEKNRLVGFEKANDQLNRLNDDGNEQENAIQFGNDGDTIDDYEKRHKSNGAFNSIENNIPTTKIEIELIDEPGASKDDVKVIGAGDDDDYVIPVDRTNIADKVTDFTSELQLKDDMVSKIEQSFRESSMTHVQPITINHPVNPMGFIERRVKKFDPLLRKRLMQNDDSKDSSSLGQKSIEDNIILHRDDERSGKMPTDKPNQGTMEKVTTLNVDKIVENKPINNNANSSKSQTLDKNNKAAGDLIRDEQRGINAHEINPAKKDLILSTLQPIKATEQKILFINVNSNGNNTSNKNELERMQKDREQIIKESQLANAQVNKTNSINGTQSNMHLRIFHDDTISEKPLETIETNYSDANKQSPIVKSTSIASTSSSFEVKPTKSSVTLNQTTSKESSITSPDAISPKESNSDKHLSSPNPPSVTQSLVSTESTKTMQTKSRSNPKQKPYGRRGFDGFYFETECDMQTPLPNDATIWRGNETHELNLPTTTPENCSGDGDCMPMIISWEGAAEIQSGDVLIVEIDDTLLLPADMNPIAVNDNGHKAATAVYQVTRPGHEHCDATEGILLDITPLVVDGKKLVTLYDKDLTEGVNLLIVVSDLWGPQCVRLKVTVKSDNCGENAQCSGKGVCFSNTSMEGYECQCCTGFAGSHCEEIDACSPSPCTNNGICVDLSQGHDGNSYQCLCPYGYTGKNCQFESDPCQNGECQNGGTCTGNATHFKCECAPGFTGPLCQHNLNECESSPCVHGICVDQEDGFRCFCQPGFAGELCNYEYNECDSNPCLNDGKCTDHVGGFSCKCTHGYTGKRCHIKVDFCANNPCPEGHQCNDHGNDFSCECPEGRTGLDCNQIPRTKCNVNPCANGGTCWTSDESFYCACRAGFTGKMCEDAVVNTNEITSDADAATTHARPFGESSFSAVISKGSTIGLHNVYIAVGTFATAIFIVAIVVIVCHCKFHKSYRRFTTRQHQLIPIFGFGRRAKQQLNNPRHWLSGKGHLSSSNKTASTTTLNQPNLNSNTNMPNYHPHLSQQMPRFQRHLSMNLENDMYYTVDFSDAQNSPLIH